MWLAAWTKLLRASVKRTEEVTGTPLMVLVWLMEVVLVAEMRGASTWESAIVR